MILNYLSARKKAYGVCLHTEIAREAPFFLWNFEDDMEEDDEDERERIKEMKTLDARDVERMLLERKLVVESSSSSSKPSSAAELQAAGEEEKESCPVVLQPSGSEEGSSRRRSDMRNTSLPSSSRDAVSLQSSDQTPMSYQRGEARGSTGSSSTTSSLASCSSSSSCLSQAIVSSDASSKATSLSSSLPLLSPPLASPRASSLSSSSSVSRVMPSWRPSSTSSSSSPPPVPLPSALSSSFTPPPPPLAFSSSPSVCVPSSSTSISSRAAPTSSGFPSSSLPLFASSSSPKPGAVPSSAFSSSSPSPAVGQPPQSARVKNEQSNERRGRDAISGVAAPPREIKVEAHQGSSLSEVTTRRNLESSVNVPRGPSSDHLARTRLIDAALHPARQSHGSSPLSSSSSPFSAGAASFSSSLPVSERGEREQQTRQGRGEEGRSGGDSLEKNNNGDEGGRAALVRGAEAPISRTRVKEEEKESQAVQKNIGFNMGQRVNTGKQSALPPLQGGGLEHRNPMQPRTLVPSSFPKETAGRKNYLGDQEMGSRQRASQPGVVSSFCDSDHGRTRNLPMSTSASSPSRPGALAYVAKREKVTEDHPASAASSHQSIPVSLIPPAFAPSVSPPFTATSSTPASQYSVPGGRPLVSAGRSPPVVTPVAGVSSSSARPSHVTGEAGKGQEKGGSEGERRAFVEPGGDREENNRNGAGSGERGTRVKIERGRGGVPVPANASASPRRAITTTSSVGERRWESSAGGITSAKGREALGVKEEKRTTGAGRVVTNTTAGEKSGRRTGSRESDRRCVTVEEAPTSMRPTNDGRSLKSSESSQLIQTKTSSSQSAGGLPVSSSSSLASSSPPPRSSSSPRCPPPPSTLATSSPVFSSSVRCSSSSSGFREKKGDGTGVPSKGSSPSPLSAFSRENHAEGKMREGEDAVRKPRRDAAVEGKSNKHRGGEERTRAPSSLPSSSSSSSSSMKDQRAGLIPSDRVAQSAEENDEDEVVVLEVLRPTSNRKEEGQASRVATSTPTMMASGAATIIRRSDSSDVPSYRKERGERKSMSPSSLPSSHLSTLPLSHQSSSNVSWSTSSSSPPSLPAADPLPSLSPAQSGVGLSPSSSRPSSTPQHSDLERKDKDRKKELGGGVPLGGGEKNVPSPVPSAAASPPSLSSSSSTSLVLPLESRRDQGVSVTDKQQFTMLTSQKDGSPGGGPDSFGVVFFSSFWSLVIFFFPSVVFCSSKASYRDALYYLLAYRREETSPPYRRSKVRRRRESGRSWRSSSPCRRRRFHNVIFTAFVGCFKTIITADTR